jgi:4'-phosphopantetheinyl transferase
MAWVGDHVKDVGAFSRAFLSDEECARLDTYRSQAAAERYVVTRSLVRIVLGEHLGETPRAVKLSRTDAGKPLTERVHFNVSHSGDLILLAVSDARAIGVDVERRRPVPKVDALIQRWLTHDERANLDRIRGAGAEQSDAFLRVWSLKEARLKALGVGISGAARPNLPAVEVHPLDGMLDALAHRPGEQGYVGAVAFA